MNGAMPTNRCGKISEHCMTTMADAVRVNLIMLDMFDKLDCYLKMVVKHHEASRDITIESYKWYRLHLLTFECIRLIFTHAASRLKRANKKAIPFLSRRLAMHRDEFLRCVAQEINDSVYKGLPTRLLVLLPRNLGHTAFSSPKIPKRSIGRWTWDVFNRSLLVKTMLNCVRDMEGLS